MTVAQTKAKRRFWTKIDKRYLGRIKDAAASKRKDLEKVAREHERQARKSTKKK